MDFSSIKDVHIPLFDITTLVLADRDADGLFSLEQDVMGFALHVYRTYARLAKITSGTTATSASSSLRHLVSGSKYRTVESGFDLDLTYVTPRILALGLPASGLETHAR